MGRRKKEMGQPPPEDEPQAPPPPPPPPPGPHDIPELNAAKSIMCHKKFGKYNLTKSIELSPSSYNGSDTEMTQLIDPNASSESTCSTPLHDSASQDSTFSDTAPRFLKTFSKSKATKKQPLTFFDPEVLPGDDNLYINLSLDDNETQLPDPLLDVVQIPDPRRKYRVMSDGFNSDDEDSLPPDLDESYEQSPEEEEAVTFEDVSNSNDDDSTSYCSTLFDECLNLSPKTKDIAEELNSFNFPTSSGPIIINDEFSAFQEKMSGLAIIQVPKMSRDSSLSSLDSISYDAPHSRESLPTENCTPTKIKPVKQRKPRKSKTTPSPKKNSKKKENDNNAEMSTDSSNSSISSIRRSSRIKTISVMKQRSKGHGLVRVSQGENENCASSDSPKKDKMLENNADNVFSATPPASKVSDFPVPSLEPDYRPVKVKSRWRRSSEMEMGSQSPITPPLTSPNVNIINSKHNTIYEVNASKNIADSSDANEFITKRLSQFEIIYENIYHCDRTISKEARKMTCDCFLTKEEIERGELGCGEDCLNRLLMIECNSRCPVGNRCTNRRFQSLKYSELKVIKTEKKGLGIQAVKDIKRDEFLMEYVGEVLNSKQFHKRAEEYSSDKNTHHYFMALKGDAVIDATLKGNVSRFINHSCDPNSETQKWTVNGELRIGFFSKRNIKAGEEITFDYQFQRYGKEAQKCYCEASNCRGWIGEEPDDSESEEEEPEEESEDEKEVIAEKEEEKDIEKPIVETSPIEDIKKEIITKKEPRKAKSKEISKKRGRPRKSSRDVKELLQDVDLKEDMESLKRSGIKNQSHTLSLCRAMVRAKWIEAKKTLLDLLANADLPCRRLFLDYRGLKLLAPWCEESDTDFRQCLLKVLEKLPIPNRTIIHECKLTSYIERWISKSTSYNDDSSDNSRSGTPLIDELNNSCKNEKNDVLKDVKVNSDIPVVYPSQELQENIVKSAKHLLERWSKLKEEFKIPKKERIQLMKEHERQANETRIKSDYEKKSSRESERWEERYSRHDKKRIRTLSPDASRRAHIRMDDRVLSSIPQMSKEERRREFAARVAREEQMKHNALIAAPIVPTGAVIMPHGQWVLPQPYVQGVHHPTYPGIILNTIPTVNHQEYAIPTYPQECIATAPGFIQPYYPQPQPAYSTHPILETGVEYVTPHFNTNPTIPQTHYQSIPVSNSPQTPNAQRIPVLGSTIVNVTPNYPTYLASTPQPIPTLTSSVPSSYPPQLYEEVADQNMYYDGTIVPETYPEPLSSAAMVVEQVLAPIEVHKEIPVAKELEIEKKYVTQLPPQWRSAVDDRGRTYFYHVQYRIPHWEPPLQSTVPNNDDSGDDEASDDEKNETVSDECVPTMVEGVDGIYQVIKENKPPINGLKKNKPGSYFRNRKHRPKLITEWIISPRTEEDKAASKIELKRYKENKEKMRRRREQAMLASASNHKKKERHYAAMVELAKNDEVSRRIKELFLSNMSRVIVQQLNPYRRDDCTIGHITSNADFKHLARKLTHFVMLKELKHCKNVSELQCNTSVKQKAKEFIKKYMVKFGPVYQRPPDEMGDDK